LESLTPGSNHLKNTTSLGPASEIKFCTKTQDFAKAHHRFRN